MNGLQQNYAMPQGILLLKELTSRGIFIFATAEARDVAIQCGISESAITRLLHQLVNSGWLLRLRRGLFAGTGALPGGVNIHPFAIATRLFEPSAISHWSALQHHGLTEQLPQFITVMTPCEVVTPSMRKVIKSDTIRHGKHHWTVASEEIEFISIQSRHFFGIEQVWVDQLFRVPITDRERTLLDLCVSPRRFGGMTEVLGIFDEHWQSCDVMRLVSYALEYNVVTVAKRLGWTLETVGTPAKIIEPLLKLPTSSVGLLDPSHPNAGSIAQRWSLRNNLSV